MNQEPSDTSPDVEQIMIEGYRNMPAWRKIRQVFELNQLAQQLAMNDIRRNHPNASNEELKLRLASRWIDPEILRKAFNWDPEKEGY